MAAPGPVGCRGAGEAEELHSGLARERPVPPAGGRIGALLPPGSPGCCSKGPLPQATHSAGRRPPARRGWRADPAPAHGRSLALRAVGPAGAMGSPPAPRGKWGWLSLALCWGGLGSLSLRSRSRAWQSVLCPQACCHGDCSLRGRDPLQPSWASSPLCGAQGEGCQRTVCERPCPARPPSRPGCSLLSAGQPGLSWRQLLFLPREGHGTWWPGRAATG